MSEPFIAQINLWANAFTVQFWAQCSGQLLAIGQNPALYSLIGTIYGGDGRISMGVPNLNHRAPMGNGLGPGLTNRISGDMPGFDMISLTPDQLPTHNHGKPVGAAAELSEEAAPSNTVTMGMRQTTSAQLNYKTGASSDHSKYKKMSDHTISTTGGNQPHQNMQPYLGLYFQMALTGIYPPRS